LHSFPKVSGKKGIHVHVPLNGAATFAQTKAVARALAERLEQQHPDRVISNMRRSLREGRVFIDWSQNGDSKTTVCVYSLRAAERPTISAPVTWEELEAALRKRDAAPLGFDAGEILERVQRLGDLYEPVLQLRQGLPDVAAVKAA
jgi:bifunctional non-homologous end joining protein LigD